MEAALPTILATVPNLEKKKAAKSWLRHSGSLRADFLEPFALFYAHCSSVLHLKEKIIFLVGSALSYAKICTIV